MLVGMRLSDWAKGEGIHCQTAWKWFRQGTLAVSVRQTATGAILVDEPAVDLPRIGHVRTHEPTSKLRRALDAGGARILSATVGRDGDRWYCSFCCAVERADTAPSRPDAVVGVDVGVRRLAVLSTGEQIENPRALERAQRRLRRY